MTDMLKINELKKITKRALTSQHCEQQQNIFEIKKEIEKHNSELTQLNTQMKKIVADQKLTEEALGLINTELNRTVDGTYIKQPPQVPELTLNTTGNGYKKDKAEQFTERMKGKDGTSVPAVVYEVFKEMSLSHAFVSMKSLIKEITHEFEIPINTAKGHAKSCIKIGKEQLPSLEVTGGGPGNPVFFRRKPVKVGTLEEVDEFKERERKIRNELAGRN